MKQTLGSSIKKIRKEKHLSQKELANQICSQSMLSSIENDLYTPNALLLIKLCEKLSINLSEISLSDNFEISDTESFNQINTDEQTQAYYLGVACFQTKFK